jgi:hypothetical protein
VDQAIPRWVVVWRHTSAALVILLAGATLVASLGLLVQIALDPRSPRWHDAGPATLGSAMFLPFCVALMYLEWRLLVRREAGAERFLGAAGLLFSGGLLFSFGLGALGLLGVGSPNPEYPTWSAVGWTGGIAVLVAFVGGGHWVWAGHVRTASEAVSDSPAEQAAAAERPHD